MVPESHELLLPATSQLREFLKSGDYQTEVREKLKSQYEVDLNLRTDSKPVESEEPSEERLLLAYTRNNAGGLKDAIDFLVSRLIPHGLDASTVKGAIPRPKSDSFEDSLPFFDSKLLHNAPALLGTDSPTRSTFGDDVSDRGSLFGKIRKPGSISSISSFLDRRKNQSGSPGSQTFFKQASSNASRASLVSMESRDATPCSTPIFRHRTTQHLALYQWIPGPNWATSLTTSYILLMASLSSSSFDASLLHVQQCSCNFSSLSATKNTP